MGHIYVPREGRKHIILFNKKLAAAKKKQNGYNGRTLMNLLTCGHLELYGRGQEHA